MSAKKDKQIRKENQLTRRQMKEVFDTVMLKLLTSPWKIRWRLALKILKGNKDGK